MAEARAVEFPNGETFQRSGEPEVFPGGFESHDFLGGDGGEADITVNMEHGEVVGRVAADSGKKYLIRWVFFAD